MRWQNGQRDGAWQPHLVLCQEISRPRPVAYALTYGDGEHAGDDPLLGPPSPGPVTGDHHPAILVAASAGR